MDTIRESLFGSTVRGITGNRVFGYVEDQPDWVFSPPPSSTDATLVNTRAGSVSDGLEKKEPDDLLRRQEDLEGLRNPADESPVRHDPTSADTVSWYGESDPLNPQNYSSTKKLLLTCLLGLYTCSVYIASAIYTPGLVLLEEEFGANQTKATLGLTLFVLGYGISPMVLTPLTMIPKYGRRNIYVGSFFLFLAFLIGSAAAPTLAGFLVLRLLSGMAGSPAISTVGISLADMWAPMLLPRAIAVWGSSASLGPILGPLIGAAAIERFGTWRSPLWLLACVSAFTLICMVFFLPETSAAKILDDRKRRIVKRTGSSVQTEWEKSGMDVTISGTILTAIRISVDPTIAYVDAQIALAYLILYSWFESFPLVFGEGGYGFSPVIQGVMYLFLGGGVVLAVAGYLLWLRISLEPEAKRNNGHLTPKSFLAPGFIGVICMPICLLGFGWTANRVHWIVPALFTVLFGPAIFLAFMSSLNYVSAGFFEHLISIFALNAFFRSVFASFGPLYSNPALNAINVSWYSTVLGIASLAMVPLPVLLYYKGDAMRAKSKWAFKPPTGDATPETEKSQA